VIVSRNGQSPSFRQLEAGALDRGVSLELAEIPSGIGGWSLDPRTPPWSWGGIRLVISPPVVAVTARFWAASRISSDSVVECAETRTLSPCRIGAFDGTRGFGPRQTAKPRNRGQKRTEPKFKPSRSNGDPRELRPFRSQESLGNARWRRSEKRISTDSALDQATF